MARSATTVVLQKQFPRTRKLSCLQTGRHTTSSKCTTHFTCCSMLTEMSVAHTHGHPACSGSFGVYSAMNALRRRMHCTNRDGSNSCPSSDASASSSTAPRCTTWRSLPCLSQPSSGSSAAFFLGAGRRAGALLPELVPADACAMGTDCTSRIPSTTAGSRNLPTPP